MKKKFYNPAMRVNSAKGHSYVQVRDFLTGKWLTVGELSPKNLGLGFGMLMEAIRENHQEKAFDSAEKHGIEWNPKTKKEFYETWNDQEAILAKDHEMFTKKLENMKKVEKRIWKKMRKALKIPKDNNDGSCKTGVQPEGSE